ncbi:hypothetical protein FGIG_06868 [Fasciola gigantica]|uniref:Uncharacterized protein n=1 Tax=Fasciola gigantica TaxID=46835 RepID=A0A504XML7_FASGI|nr:hypothetical protein FGIG_06868 [Fasciola gigantica]
MRAYSTNRGVWQTVKRATTIGCSQTSSDANSCEI